MGAVVHSTAQLCMVPLPSLDRTSELLSAGCCTKASVKASCCAIQQLGCCSQAAQAAAALQNRNSTKTTVSLYIRTNATIIKVEITFNMYNEQHQGYSVAPKATD
jgi:hypothetical protein